MSETLSATPAITKYKINPLRIVASALFLIVAIVSCFNPDLLGIQNMLTILNMVDAKGVVLQYTFAIVALPIGSLALAVLGLFVKKGWIMLWLSVGFYVLVAPLSWAIQVFYISQSQWGQIFWSLSGNDSDFKGWLALIALTLAVGLTVVANFAGDAASKEPISVPVTPSGTISESGAPSNLPIFALVGAFVIPIAGVIFGHMAISQMNRGQISSANRNFARIGLIVGYIFTALSLMALIFVLVVLYQFGYFTAHYY